MIYLLEMPPLTGNQLLIAVLAVFAAVIGLIFFMRDRFKKAGKTDLGNSAIGKTRKSPLEGRNKYPEVDAFKYSGTLLNFGFLASLGLMILAFSWTCLLYTSPSPRDRTRSRMPSSA